MTIQPGILHKTPETQCDRCGEYFWACDVVGGLCEACFNARLNEESCVNCRWRTGTRCNKLEEYIDIQDWCGHFSKEEE